MAAPPTASAPPTLEPGDGPAPTLEPGPAPAVAPPSLGPAPSPDPPRPEEAPARRLKGREWGCRRRLVSSSFAEDQPPPRCPRGAPAPSSALPHRPPEPAGWAGSRDGALAMPARRRLLLLLLLALLLPGSRVSDRESWDGGTSRGPAGL